MLNKGQLIILGLIWIAISILFSDHDMRASGLAMLGIGICTD